MLVRRGRGLFLFIAMAAIGWAQEPDVAAQREAMKKLGFLIGKWSGDGTVARGRGESLKLRQSEDVQYKLDGLVMLVEGTGRDALGQVVFRALATISYDDVGKTYRFRAFNDGRYLDAEMKVSDNGFEWGYTIDAAGGPLKVANKMQVDAKGAWVETTESTYGANPPQRSVEMNLKRQP
jgi:hypothetical protein